jgi:hypothetical protein
MQIPTQKIGTARSGRVIKTFTTDDWEIVKQQIESYSFEDHFDAWVVFERLTVRAMRRFDLFSAEYSRFIRYASIHKGCISDDFIAAEKLRLGLATSPDLVRFAAKLTEDVFLD